MSKNLSKLNKIIEACRYVLAILDGLEEQRILSIQENNFRNALKKHQLKLLEAKRIYWKNRAKIKWAQLGNENTKFFHIVATQNFRGNFIATLKTDDDRLITDHGAKEAIIWNSFKNRIGCSDNPEMLFDLESLISPITNVDFESLEVPFFKKKFDNVIKEMPPDKSPGPDGFNGAFLKKSWSTVKALFYKLCERLYIGDLNIESINTAYVTLIPKIQDLESINDFRPISLLSISLKIITKLLANRSENYIAYHS